jgi:hypothetical protein
MKTILVPVDFSNKSRQPLDFAIQLNTKLNNAKAFYHEYFLSSVENHCMKGPHMTLMLDRIQILKSNSESSYKKK